MLLDTTFEYGSFHSQLFLCLNFFHCAYFTSTTNDPHFLFSDKASVSNEESIMAAPAKDVL